VSLTDEQYKRIHSFIIRDYEDLPLLPLLHSLPDYRSDVSNYSISDFTYLLT